jgi:RHS repeat-associated protein
LSSLLGTENTAFSGLISVLDLDFNNDGVEELQDLFTLASVIASDMGSDSCGTPTSVRPCDNPDFNQDGHADYDDVGAFSRAIIGDYVVQEHDIREYRFLYRGYWYDRHLNIYHVRHRAYDPKIQRWLQPDPAMFIDGLNRYAYCGNDPINLYDPMGLYGLSDFVHEVSEGGQELVDHLSGLNRAQDGAWSASMQMQQSVSGQSLANANAQLNEVRNSESREIISATVNAVAIVATGGLAAPVTISGAVGTGIAVGAGSNLVAQGWQIEAGVRGSWNPYETMEMAVWGGLGGGVIHGGGKLVSSGIGSSAGPAVGSNLWITNRLNGYTQRAVREFDADPFGNLSRAQWDDVPRRLTAHRGQRIDQMAKNYVDGDTDLLRFIDVTRQGKKGADFIRKDGTEWWDMTTTGQWGSHCSKYGPGGTRLPTD